MQPVSGIGHQLIPRPGLRRGIRSVAMGVLFVVVFVIIVVAILGLSVLFEVISAAFGSGAMWHQTARVR